MFGLILKNNLIKEYKLKIAECYSMLWRQPKDKVTKNSFYNIEALKTICENILDDDGTIYTLQDVIDTYCHVRIGLYENEIDTFNTMKDFIKRI